MKRLFQIVLCFVLIGCNIQVPKEELYKVEHNGNTIIVQRILANATSANYIQVLVNEEKVLNIREESIFVDHIECNDSLIMVYKKEWDEDIKVLIVDTLYIGNFLKSGK